MARAAACAAAARRGRGAMTSTAWLSMTFMRFSSPFAASVPPVSTRSQTASASPSRTISSTPPSHSTKVTPDTVVANWLRLGNLLMLWRVRGVFGDRFRSLAGDLAFLYLAPLPFFALAAWLLPPGSWPRFAASIAAAHLAAWALAARYWRPFRTFFGK